MARRFRALAGVCVFLAFASVGFAQLPTGTILGSVKDSSGGVVPGARVTVQSAETDLSRTVDTSDDGGFRIPALPVGRYNVKFEKEGFKTETQTGLTLEVGQDLVLNAALEVGTAQQQVVVTGEAPVVNTTNGSLGGLVNEQKVEDLPLNGRNWIDLTLLQPGITRHTNLGGGSPVAVLGVFFSSNGATTHSNNFMLDGAMMVNIQGANQSSVSSSSLGVDGIREYKVETNAFSAEYGLSMGSQTTIVSKGGSNTWHGSAFEYLRNSSMDAANFFDNAASSGINAEGHVRRLPEFIRNNFGGSFGGPIRKDKTFFFAVFEGIQERKGLTLNGTALGDGTNNTVNCRVLTNNPCAVTAANKTGAVNAYIAPLLGIVPGGTLPYLQRPTSPAATAGSMTAPFSFPFTEPISEQYGQIRLDHSFSAKDTAFARYTIDVTTLRQPNIPTPNQNETDHLKSGTQFTTISETHIFSTSFLSTARFSISRTPQELGNVMPSYIPPGSTTPTTFVSDIPTTLGIGNIAVGNGVTSFTAGIPAHHDQKIYAWSDDLFYTKGRNAFKFGALITNWKQRMELQNTYRGSLSFNSISNFLNGLLANSSNNYSAATPGSIIQRNYTSGTMGYYIQDDIRVNSRFIVNAGLRYEFLYPDFHEVNGYESALRNLYTDATTTVGPPIKDRTDKDFSPRLGFAWDVMGDGKTSLRGGGALLFDTGNIGPVLYRAAGATPPFASTSQVSGGTACATTAGPLQIPFVFPACAVGKTLTIQDYNMRPAHLLVYNLTLERQLPWGVGLSVGYAGSRGFDLINITEGNPILPTANVNGRPEWQAVLCGTAMVPTAGATCPTGQASVANPAYVRVNPNWASITLMGDTSNSWYNSLQTVLTKRLQNGLQFQGSYTYSKNLDEGSGFGTADNSTASWNPVNPLDNRAPAGFDATHNLRFNTIYHLPQFDAKGGIVGGFVNGWWTSFILSWETGVPFTPTESTNRSASGVLTNLGDRPDFAPGFTSTDLDNITNGVSAGCTGIPKGTPVGTPTLWFDPCAFQVSQPGLLGQVGRNVLRGPDLSEVDISVDKDTPLKFLGEGGQLQFRAEIFNVFNHPSFAIPVTSVFTAAAAGEAPLSTAGLIQTTVNTSRQVQLALKVVF